MNLSTNCFSTMRGTIPFLSRDPINESGFKLMTHADRAFSRAEEKNLHAFVNNNPISNVDYLGLLKVCIRPLQMCKFTTAIVHCY
jgi:hypothetical protein